MTVNQEIINKKVKVRPIFNYIGGKTWLREELRDKVSGFISVGKKQCIERYVEPFCGGLGAFINVYDLLIKMNIKKVVLSDINPHLISFYNTMCMEKEILLNEYMKIENEYISLVPEKALSLNKTKNKEEMKILLCDANEYFKKIRSEYNESHKFEDTCKIVKSARLLFLQNHCYNGVHRENEKGEYNTPFNWDSKIYKRELIEKKLADLTKILNEFESVSFINSDFNDLEFYETDLIYCDPPYINEKEGENKYSKAGFYKKDQVDLIVKISPHYFIYSNHKNNLLIETFRENTKFTLKEVKRKNTISAKNETRGEEKTEILVCKKIK